VRRLLLVAVLALAPLAAAATTPTVTVARHKGVGTIVVTGSGLTLYHMTLEKKGVARCVGVCTRLWPPLTVSGGGKPKTGPGIDASKLGTFKRPDGIVQVTYYGLGLYRYVYDRKPGSTKSQGYGGNWYAVTPSGQNATTGASSGTDCPMGQTIPTGSSDGNDGDDRGGPSDGDGCI
jgi:predicted lipoprotein with Yx(FWY)xxD motif